MGLLGTIATKASRRELFPMCFLGENFKEA